MNIKHRIHTWGRIVVAGTLVGIIGASGSASACSRASYSSSPTMNNASGGGGTDTAMAGQGMVSTAAAVPEQNSTAQLDTQYQLDAELREHAALAVPVLKAQLLNEADAGALMTAMDTNSQQIASTVEQLYPGTHDQFLQLWRSHILYYQQYLTAAQRQDQAGKDQSRQNLANFVGSLTNLLVSANPQLDKATLTQALTTHGDQTLAIIDNLVAGNYTEVYMLAHQAYEHMAMVAAATTGNASVAASA
jgi:hypothetical protein